MLWEVAATGVSDEGAFGGEAGCSAGVLEGVWHGVVCLFAFPISFGVLIYIIRRAFSENGDFLFYRFTKEIFPFLSVYQRNLS